jgi:3-isopropylmalate/(R)-2-methylmalate dehydratase small subunit
MARVVLRLGADVSTDDIYPGRYLATVLPSETPRYCFADRSAFNERLLAGEVPAGSVVVAGHNFGCGSSREQAVSTLVGHGLIVVARSVARIFLQNAVNLGLRVFLCPDVEAQEGDQLGLGGERVVNRTAGAGFEVTPLPPARQAIIDAGGLIPYTRARVLEAAGAPRTTDRRTSSS